MTLTVDTSLPNVRLLDLVSGLTDPARRTEAAHAIALHVGSEELIIFVYDQEVSLLLPAPGFPQTLPGGRVWRKFLSACVAAGHNTGELPFPDASTVRPATGHAARDGSVLVLLGGTPHREELIDLGLLLPLIAAAFRGEMAAEAAESNAATARRSAAQAKLLAEALDTARRDLQHALHMRDQFLTIAAHELKTPLTSLLGYCQVVKRRVAREGGLSERNQAALDTIYAQAQRLHGMVNQLFDLARTQTGIIQVVRKPVDLVVLCRRLVDEIQPTLEKHRVELHAYEPVVISGDEQRLEQVLQNLVDNAIKYSPDGGLVTVSVTREEGSGCISVRDDGMGIPEEGRLKLFDRYYRAGNVDPRNISGLGIGLYLVNQIVTSHGGKIHVTSEMRKGSVFTVCLPHRQASDEG